MLCPFNLCQVRRFTVNKDGGYACPSCQEPVPALYIQNYSVNLPVVLSSVGFRGHGKTVFLAALFDTFSRPELTNYWPAFYKSAAGQSSLDILDDNIRLLRQGELPNSTAQNFPKPTLVQIKGIPTGKNATLLCYDAAGESFEKIQRLVSYAKFLTRATSVLFLLSIPDLEREYADVAQEMERLLNVYSNGIAELGGKPRTQRLVVVYSKADEWRALTQPKCSGLMEHLKRGTFDGYEDYGNYKKSLCAVSKRLRDLTTNDLKAQGFINHAKDNFLSVEFCVISSLGALPEGQHLRTGIAPRRVLDPLLWVLDPKLSSARNRLWPWK